MKNIVKIVIARLLLLYFVVAIIPLDLYHKHAYRHVASRKQEITANRLSQSIFTSHCLICDLHLDRNVYQEAVPLLLSLYETSSTLIKFTHRQKVYASIASHFHLRGPPHGMIVSHR